jgi:predicted nucleic acid-binding Zn ribbon protein
MEKKRNKRKEFEHIRRVIDRTLHCYRNEPDMELAQIWDRWDRIVGKVVAENAQPAAFKGKILMVHVVSSTWIHQLQFVKAEMISKLNRALGKELVKEIKFKIGALK